MLNTPTKKSPDDTLNTPKLIDDYVMLEIRAEVEFYLNVVLTK